MLRRATLLLPVPKMRRAFLSIPLLIAVIKLVKRVFHNRREDRLHSAVKLSNMKAVRSVSKGKLTRLLRFGK